MDNDMPSSPRSMPARPAPMGGRPQMPPPGAPSMPSKGGEGRPPMEENEKNAMMVGMAVLRGEIDLASLDPQIAEIVIQVLDKYHPGWQKTISRSGPPPSRPGMPMGQRPPGGGDPRMMQGRPMPPAQAMRKPPMMGGSSQNQPAPRSPSGPPPMGMK